MSEPTNGRRVALLSGGTEIREGGQPARDRYASSVFNLSVRWAERFCDRWYLVSGGHGLVAPGRVSSDYEVSVDGMAAFDRWKWARGIAGSVTRHNAGAEIMLLADAASCDALSEFLEFHNPLAGLEGGERLEWLEAQLAVPAARAR